ncbi:MAG: MerR family transcriptional regulator [Erysipelotrichaceae bacterium]|nr:MerR family transcriptional regulator [Erysipelotrichaceae bacterium]
MNESLYHRKEIIKRFCISRRIIENYEKLGLVKHTGKDNMGYYLYDEKTVRAIGRIRFLQLLGLSLEEIRRIINGSRTYEKQIIIRQISYLQKQPKRISRLIRAAGMYLEDKDGFLEKETVRNLFIEETVLTDEGERYV